LKIIFTYLSTVEKREQTNNHFVYTFDTNQSNNAPNNSKKPIEFLEVTNQNMSKVSKLLKTNTKSELLALLMKSR